MTIWEVGTTWGPGGVDYLELMKEHGIMVCRDSPMEIGDIVAIAKGQTVIALARITGQRFPAQDDQALAQAFAQKKMNSSLGGEDSVGYVAKADIWELAKEDCISYKIIKSHVRIGKDDIKSKILSLVAKKDKTAMIDECLELLKANHNLILTGAPGTGKTHLAREIAGRMAAAYQKQDYDSDKDYSVFYAQTQFHPSYDYTDFMEGLRPHIINGNPAFQRVDGEFKKFCKLALQNPAQPYIFIIDEINRGELSRIFGEVFYSIEPGYRGSKGKISTQYQNLVPAGDAFADGFFVPENVYLIGTMNNIDRSVENFDLAMRRRFAWREISAQESAAILDDDNGWAGVKPPPEIIEKLKNRMANLNQAILSPDIGLSADYQIGGAYFLNYAKYKDHQDPFLSLWRYHLKGLLADYLPEARDREQKIALLKSAYDNESPLNDNQG